MPDQPVDYSQRLAEFQVRLIILRERAPEGDWAKSPLLQKWQNNRYSLTLREFKELEQMTFDECQKLYPDVG